MLSLLEAEFDDAEREYQHTDVDTASEDIASEEEETMDDQPTIVGEEEGNGLTQGEQVETESSFEDRAEQAKVDEFFRVSCGCKLGPRSVACSSVVSKEAVVQTRNNCLQMAKNELDLVVMAQINALRTHHADQASSCHG